MQKISAISVFILICLLCGTPLAFGNDIYHSVNRDETLYADIISPSGSVVYRGTAFIISQIAIDDTGDERIFRAKVQTSGGLTGWLATDAIFALGSVEFPNVALPNKITASRWMHSYHLDVLRSGDRERLFEFEPFWRDDFNDYQPWFFFASPNPMFFGNVFVWVNELVNTYHFANGPIEEEDGVYSFYAIGIYKNVIFEECHFGKYFSFSERSRFSLQLDGDYLGVFVDGVKMFEIVRLDEQFENQYQNLMYNNTVDLSYITFWPRRSDGSMDIPPPDGVLLAFRASHRTTDRLRVRDNPTTDANIVATLDLGAEIQILETGSVSTIAGITAPWVRLLSAEGYTGWSFSGFLETVAVSGGVAEIQPAVVAASIVAPVNIAAENVPVPSAMPLWVWLTIGGGAIAVAGGVFVARRKR